MSVCEHDMNVSAARQYIGTNHRQAIDSGCLGSQVPEKSKCNLKKN